jgi:Tol biopolymer transport system component
VRLYGVPVLWSPRLRPVAVGAACAFAIALLVALVGCESVDKTLAPQPGLRPTIGRFDTFAGTESVLVVWHTGNYPLTDSDSRRPAPPVKSVCLFLSLTGPDDGFVPVVTRTQIGADSVFVANLQIGHLNYFRLETYDSLGHRIERSRALETQTGPVDETVASIEGVNREGGYYYPPMAWTRDGGSILAIEGEQREGPNLVEHNLLTGQSRPVTTFPPEPARLSSVAVCPDSDRVAFCYSSNEYGGPYRIWVLTLASGGLRQVTDGVVDADPAWGPGGRLYFTRGTDGPPNIPEIYLVRPDILGEPSAVLDNGQYKYGLSVDPLGQRIAYSANEAGKYDSSRRSIYALTLATGGVNQLLPASSSTNEKPCWSADGREIFFVSDRSGHFEAWSLNVTSGRLTQRSRGESPGLERYAARPSPDGTQLALFEPRYGEASGAVRVIRLP